MADAPESTVYLLGDVEETPAEPSKDPQASTADAIAEVSAIPDTLHMAARAGNLETVSMLLRNKANPNDKDSDGKTALQYAKEADVIAALKGAMDPGSYEDAAPAASPSVAFSAQPERELPPPPSNAPASGAAAEAPAQDALDKAMEAGSPNNGGKGNNSSSRGGSPERGNNTSQMSGHDDLKARTMFEHTTQDGVLKRTTFIHKLSTYRSSPEVSIASRGESMFLRSGAGPAPGTYNLPNDEKSKFKASSCYSFGGSSRFGLGTAPAKIQPGPGQYHPIDPSLCADHKVGFGTSVRNRRHDLHENPGPGAYEVKSTVGGGMMFTARGRQPASYMRSRSMPGPGAYAPTIAGAYMTAPKCGFGTSTRNQGGAFGGAKGQPGPGTYEMQNQKCMGKDTPKFSATSRRRMHDLNSYVTPGPGTYNAHATSFGSPGAYSCQHVDENYNARDAARIACKTA